MTHDIVGSECPHSSNNTTNYNGGHRVQCSVINVGKDLRSHLPGYVIEILTPIFLDFLEILVRNVTERTQTLVKILLILHCADFMYRPN